MALPRTRRVNLFVYGTLMDKSLLYQITRKYFPTFPACLRNFKKLTSHLGYPYIVSSKGSKVEGLLIVEIDPDSMKWLDQYEDEGRLYLRKKIAVVSDGKRIACQAYVGNPKVLRPRQQFCSTGTLT